MKKTLSARNYFLRAKVFIYLMIMAGLLYVVLSFFNITGGTE